jgi:hypothetical protein
MADGELADQRRAIRAPAAARGVAWALPSFGRPNVNP